DPEALEARWVDEHGGSAVQRGELRLPEVAEVGGGEQLHAVLEQADRRAQRLEVLAPVVGGGGEDVRSVAFVERPFGDEGVVDPGIRDTDALAGDVELVDYVRGGELGVDEDEIAMLRLVSIDGVHAHRARM